MASVEAAIAIGTARETWRRSLALMWSAGSKPFSSPAMVAGNPSGSNREMRPMPLLPSASPRANASRPFPLGDRHPSPVIATRRLTHAGILWAPLPRSRVP